MSNQLALGHGPEAKPEERGRRLAVIIRTHSLRGLPDDDTLTEWIARSIREAEAAAEQRGREQERRLRQAWKTIVKHEYGAGAYETMRVFYRSRKMPRDRAVLAALALLDGDDVVSGHSEDGAVNNGDS